METLGPVAHAYKIVVAHRGIQEMAGSCVTVQTYLAAAEITFVKALLNLRTGDKAALQQSGCLEYSCLAAGNISSHGHTDP